MLYRFSPTYYKIKLAYHYPEQQKLNKWPSKFHVETGFSLVFKAIQTHEQLLRRRDCRDLYPLAQACKHSVELLAALTPLNCNALPLKQGLHRLDLDVGV